MGEVYKAVDTRLGRTVAVKVLPAGLAADPEFRQRFDREAKAISQLSHAHICTLYDVGEHEGTAFLVMEHLEGETLAQRLSKGPIPVEQALGYAIEIAGALDKAHRQGIVHRDLKPGNVMLTKAGTKLLDFGLARTGVGPVSGSLETRLSSIPAGAPLEAPLTARGTILGTFQYMAPEQVEGVEADARTDIWAFGCVLYEMLSGRRAFEGKSQVSLLGAILEREPTPISELQPTTPPALARLVRTCLAKNPDDRFQTAHDLCLQLQWIEEGGSAAGLPAPVIARRKHRERAVWLGIVAAASIATAAAAWALKPAAAPPQTIIRFAYALPGGQQFTRTGRHNVALSPDGTKLAFIADQQIYLRSLDQLEAQPLKGTNEDPVDLVFSPEGQWIAYFGPATKGGATGFALKKIAVTGGAPVKLCATDFPFGVTWRDGTIVYAQFKGGKAFIQAIADTGGTPRVLLSLDQGVIGQPQLLDDGKHLLYTWLPAAATSWEDGEVVVQPIDGGARKVVVHGGSDARLLSTGHLAYVHDGTLFAVPFDRARLETTGGPVSVLEGVRTNTATGTPGPGQFSLSSTGTLAYAPGGAALARATTLTWVDRHGVEQPIAAPARPYRYPRLSPDGAKIAVDIADEENDIWTWDLARGQLMRLTFGPAQDYYPVWMPDGRSLVYSEETNDGAVAFTFDIFRKAADNTGSAERLTKSTTTKFVSGLSPDGRLLVYREGPPLGDHNLFLLALDKTSPPQPLFQTTFSEANAEISPDGRWIAYQSNESGKYEVYVRPFPAVDSGRWEVSTGGGTTPLWSRNGRELFYVSGGKLVSVALPPAPVGGTFSFGRPQPLFALTPYFLTTGRTFDVSADGQRFLAIKLPEATKSQDALVVVSHWFDELKARVPIK
jgi:Tol biopolymer transport system component